MTALTVGSFFSDLPGLAAVTRTQGFLAVTPSQVLEINNLQKFNPSRVTAHTRHKRRGGWPLRRFFRKKRKVQVPACTCILPRQTRRFQLYLCTQSSH
jgi:hypothetical protein